VTKPSQSVLGTARISVSWCSVELRHLSQGLHHWLLLWSMVYQLVAGVFPFFPVNKDKRIDQLKLALAWNRADVASDHIFVDDARFEVRRFSVIVLKNFNSAVTILTGTITTFTNPTRPTGKYATLGNSLPICTDSQHSNRHHSDLFLVKCRDLPMV